MSMAHSSEQPDELHGALLIGTDHQIESSQSFRSTNELSRTSTTSNINSEETSSDLERAQNSTTTPSILTGPTRVPGTYPPEWLPDNETDSCMSCDTLFTLIKRRHHCRSCGKIFCGDCCRQKAKLLYLDNKEARVCSNCFRLIQCTLSNSPVDIDNTQLDQISNPANSQAQVASSLEPKVQGVLKTSNHHSRSSTNNECNTPSSSSSDQPSNKQVIFADGIRPGTDLSESCPYPVPTSSTDNPAAASFTFLTRQNRSTDNQGSSKKGRRNYENSHKTITVCDELGYLPPILIENKELTLLGNNGETTPSTSSSSPSLNDPIAQQFKTSQKSIQVSMESRSCPLNGVIKFEEISGLVGTNEVITFLLLKNFHLKVKLIKKPCCINHLKVKEQEERTGNSYTEVQPNQPVYWCFSSDGLARFGQKEVVLVLDKDEDESCIPRDVFKIYLTLHELSLRRQSLEALGNLLFQDGLFGNRDTAGLLFVQPCEEHCLMNLNLPDKTYLFALVLQRWEVPWSKVFPMRLLLRLGHKFDVYPYPFISFRSREPVYYEVGHTIISILGDFRNFRYSITHVDGMKVMLDETTRKVLVQIKQSSYQQVNKVLDSSNNDHVLAWSCCPFSEADGHLVSVQNEDGQYETVRFLKKSRNDSIPSANPDFDGVLGASFIIFSGALKVNQSGQSAKISIVEDGLLIQIQSCTMSALRDAIHYMHHFDIDCSKYEYKFFYAFSFRLTTFLILTITNHSLPHSL